MAGAVLRVVSRKASTAACHKGQSDRMNRLLIVIFAGFLVVVGAAFLILGAFPPHAHRQPVEHVLQNDKVGGK